MPSGVRQQSCSSRGRGRSPAGRRAYPARSVGPSCGAAGARARRAASPDLVGRCAALVHALAGDSGACTLRFCAQRADDHRGVRRVVVCRNATCERARRASFPQVVPPCSRGIEVDPPETSCERLRAVSQNRTQSAGGGRYAPGTWRLRSGVRFAPPARQSHAVDRAALGGDRGVSHQRRRGRPAVVRPGHARRLSPLPRSHVRDSWRQSSARSRASAGSIA